MQLLWVTVEAQLPHKMPLTQPTEDLGVFTPTKQQVREHLRAKQLSHMAASWVGGWMVKSVSDLTKESEHTTSFE